MCLQDLYTKFIIRFNFSYNIFDYYKNGEKYNEFSIDDKTEIIKVSNYIIYIQVLYIYIVNYKLKNIYIYTNNFN